MRAGVGWKKKRYEWRWLVRCLGMEDAVKVESESAVPSL